MTETADAIEAFEACIACDHDLTLLSADENKQIYRCNVCRCRLTTWPGTAEWDWHVKKISALQSQNKELREALEPFAKAANSYGVVGNPPPDDYVVLHNMIITLYLRDFRRAARALNQTPKPGEGGQDG